MWKCGLVILLGFALSGCQCPVETQYFRSASTLTVLQYQQVLDKLAMYHEDPTALPWHVNLQKGAVQVAHAGSLGTIAQTDLSHASTWSPYVVGTRSIVSQWSTVPVTDDTKLWLLRVVYQITVSYRTERELDPDTAIDLAHTPKNQTATNADISLDTNLFDSLMKSYLPDDNRDLNKLRKFYRTASDSILSVDDQEFSAPVNQTKHAFKTAFAREVNRQVVSRFRREAPPLGGKLSGLGPRQGIAHRAACFCGEYTVSVQENP